MVACERPSYLIDATIRLLSILGYSNWWSLRSWCCSSGFLDVWLQSTLRDYRYVRYESSAGPSDIALELAIFLGYRSFNTMVSSLLCKRQLANIREGTQTGQSSSSLLPEQYMTVSKNTANAFTHVISAVIKISEVQGLFTLGIQDCTLSQYFLL